MSQHQRESQHKQDVFWEWVLPRAASRAATVYWKKRCQQHAWPQIRISSSAFFMLLLEGRAGRGWGWGRARFQAPWRTEDSGAVQGSDARGTG